ncbi:MAG: IS1634 family transposase [Methanosarcina sp.]|uniref:IS1634 family transposase n=1 Tax=Methanosarcina sp. TaxID=2213 RepID=UPI002635A7C3|nr:IS1634 family transposase [Methanosarcina sp.]MDD3248739.1 IS1634 family transposase [Methanosarcina sp.]
MTSIIKKMIHNKPYYYAVRSARVNGKPRIVSQVYLGTADSIVEMKKQCESLPYIKMKSFEYGKLAALLHVNEELGFVDIVNKHTMKKSIDGLSVGEYLLLDMVGKSHGILSENGIEEWFKKSALSFMWNFPHKLSCQNFLNHMNYIDSDTMKKIEDDLCRILIEKGLTPSVLFVDESNWFTYAANYDNKSELLHKGYNKKHRKDKNQVSVALAANDYNLPFIHETYPGNVYDSDEFSGLIDKIINRLTELNICSEDLVLVFDKGNNSKENIEQVTSKMNFVGAVKANQAEELLEVPLSKYQFLYESSDSHKIYGYRTKHQFYGTEFTTVITFNEGTYKLQKRTYESNMSKIIEKLEDLQRRLESNRGKARNRSSVEKEVADIIIKKYRGVVKYEITDVPEGRKKPQLKFWIDEENENKRENSLGKNILFTDKHRWHTKKIVQTYNNKGAIEDDFKLLNDHLLVPVGPVYHHKDENIKIHVFLSIIGLLFYRYLAWETKRYGFSMRKLVENLSEIRLAVIQEKESNKCNMIMEEMSTKQASLFSFLNLGKYLPS